MKSPRFCMAIVGILAVAGTMHAGSPALSMLLLPQAFGQEPVPVSTEAAQDPELLPMPKAVSAPRPSKPQTVSVPDGGVVIIGARLFQGNVCTGDAPCCVKSGRGCAACAKPTAAVQMEACDETCLAAAKPCKCCENCEDCKDCTCGKKKTAVIRIQRGYNCDNGLVGGLIVTERSFDVSQSTGCEECMQEMCGTRRLIWIMPTAKALVRPRFDQNSQILGTETVYWWPKVLVMPTTGHGIRTMVAEQPPLAHDFRCQPPLCEEQTTELERQYLAVTAAIRHVEQQLVQLAWQQKVGQAQHVAAMSHAAAASKVQLASEHFEAECQAIHCVGDNPNVVMLEGNVRLMCKKNGVHIQAPRVQVNLKTGTFAVQSLPVAVPPPPAVAPPAAAPFYLVPTDVPSSQCPVTLPAIPPAPRPSTIPAPLIVPSPYFNW